MKLGIKNKRGDIESIIFIVVILFTIGVVFVMMNNLNHRFFDKIEQNLNSTPTLNDSYAIGKVQQIRNADDKVWDYGFLALLIGSIMALGLTAYATRISPVFFWVYGILALIVLTLGVILSNTWQKLAENPEMTTTITRFPITNFVLGTYYPLVVTIIILVVMVLLFGKTPDNQEGAF